MQQRHGASGRGRDAKQYVRQRGAIYREKEDESKTEKKSMASGQLRRRGEAISLREAASPEEQEELRAGQQAGRLAGDR